MFPNINSNKFKINQKKKLYELFNWLYSRKKSTIYCMSLLFHPRIYKALKTRMNQSQDVF